MDNKLKILKPCPLCNSTDNLMVYVEYMPVSKLNLGVVECTNEFCPMIIRADTIEEAVRKWNTRPREDFLIEQNQALTNQLVIDEEIENDLRAKLTLAIETLEYYANPNNPYDEELEIPLAENALNKIKGNPITK